MDLGALPDLDRLDKEALKALVFAQRPELASREAELENQRKQLSKQGRELLARCELIEHLKLAIEQRPGPVGGTGGGERFGQEGGGGHFGTNSEQK